MSNAMCISSEVITSMLRLIDRSRQKSRKKKKGKIKGTGLTNLNHSDSVRLNINMVKT